MSLGDGVGNSLSSAAVPSVQGGDAHRTLGQRRGDIADPCGVQAKERVGALADRDRALGVVAQREARHAQVGGFLLHTARVGKHAGGARLEREELEVADRIGKAQPGRDGHRRHPLARPRMHREEHREVLRDRAELVDYVGQQVAVHQRRPVQRHQQVTALVESVLAPRL